MEFPRAKEEPAGVWPVLGVNVRAASLDEAIDLLDSLTASGARSAVAFANANLLNLAFGDAELRRALQGFVVFNDGVGVHIGAKILHGVDFPANLNGTDFIPAYLERTKLAHRVFLIGARPESASRAASVAAARFPRHTIIGWRDGYSGLENSAALAEFMRRSKVTLVLAALGNPGQEMWLAEWLERTGASLGFAVGGLFDFWSGAATRAPALMRQARCEWIYRLAQEPRRLARRYLLGNPVFLARIASQKLAVGARPSPSRPASPTPK